MEKSIKKFLEFNGKKVYFKAVDGQWWIAIKPICEALGINYERQRQNLKSSKFYNQLPTVQQVVAADGKLREMVCLPERVIYGWIFQLESNVLGFEEFRWECNDLLFNYFHGTITEVSKHLRAKSEAKRKLEAIDAELLTMDLYRQKIELEHAVREEDKAIKRSFRTYASNQTELF